MELRCRPGDRAIVVHGANCGLIVDVIEVHPLFGSGVWLVIPHGSGVGLLGAFSSGGPVGADDFKLKPLRNSDGQDETLAWAQVPKKVEA